MSSIYIRDDKFVGKFLFPLTFINAMISLLSTLPSAFEEYLAIVIEFQLNAERVASGKIHQDPAYASYPDNQDAASGSFHHVAAPEEYLVDEETFGDDLEACLDKLHRDAKAEFDELVKQFPSLKRAG
jgi:hypothetical protein